MGKTGHKNFEMMDCSVESDYQFYEDEMSLSFFIFKNLKKKEVSITEDGKLRNASQQEFIEFFTRRGKLRDGETLEFKYRDLNKDV